MKLSLPASVASYQDLNQSLLELQHYRQWQTQAQVKQQVETSSGQPPELSESAATIVNEWHKGKQPSVKTLDKLIDSIKDIKDSAPTISITLAAPIGPRLKAQLASWCRDNLDSNALIDFSFDSTILGGMVVRWNSHIYDWSFRSKILNNKKRFTEVLRHV